MSAVIAANEATAGAAPSSWHRLDVSRSNPLARTRVSLLGVLDTHAVDALDRVIQTAQGREHSLVLDLDGISSVTPEARDELLSRQRRGRPMRQPRDATIQSPVAVARQPIFDRSGQIVGFELLHRPMPIRDADAATANVIVRSAVDIGLERLVGPHPAYVNVTREFLLAIRPLPLAPGHFVLELLENQTIDDALLEVLNELTAAGFRIALDDFRFTDGWESLIELASTAKLDIRDLTVDALADAVARLREHDVTLLAEKVETRAEYELCWALGFDAFQGYYFAEPQLVTSGLRTTLSRYDLAQGAL